jgi:hypothetical protein
MLYIQHTPLTRNESESRTVKVECRTRKDFRKDICGVLVRGEPDRSKGIGFDMSTNKMVTEVDVFRADVIGSFLRERYSASVVSKQLER